MKKAMKVLAALGICASLLTACGGGGQESVESTSGTSGSENVSTEKETDVSEMYTVTMAYIGNEQADMAKVEAAMNEMLAKEVGAQIHIIPLGWGSYQQQLQLMLSGGEKLDIVPVLLNNANSYVSSGQVIDMSELIAEVPQREAFFTDFDQVYTYVAIDEFQEIMVKLAARLMDAFTKEEMCGNEEMIWQFLQEASDETNALLKENGHYGGE